MREVDNLIFYSVIVFVVIASLVEIAKVFADFPAIKEAEARSAASIQARKEQQEAVTFDWL